MLHLLILFLASWILYPKSRVKLVFLCVCCLPVFFILSYGYAVIRIGGTLGEIGFWKSVHAILATEFGFVKRSGMIVYTTGARVDLSQFVKWIITLPIPKVLTGPVEGARINYEISELVLGKSTGSPGWHVVLSGLVAESMYIYGGYYFWVHGFVIGGLAAFFARLMERVPQFLFLFLYVALLFGYKLNRAGIGSLLPTITNQFLLFYLFVFLVILGPLAARGLPAIRPPVHHERMENELSLRARCPAQG